MSGTWSAASPPSNKFFLPCEVFRLGLKQGPLLTYLYLICRKSLMHGADKMSCATIGAAAGMGRKTVQKHVHSLIDEGLIQAKDTIHLNVEFRNTGVVLT